MNANIKIRAVVTCLILLLTIDLYSLPLNERAQFTGDNAAYFPLKEADRSDNFYRTELFFGRSIPGGGMVTDDEWEKFLAEVVTPRFPDGFTILKATGQYRETGGKIDKEQSEVLIFLYSQSKRASSRRKIEEIRRTYVKQFKQESVLRLDFPLAVKVNF